jgi:putative nucleotidyltransferase with HDIG domain
MIYRDVKMECHSLPLLPDPIPSLISRMRGEEALNSLATLLDHHAELEQMTMVLANSNLFTDEAYRTREEFLASVSARLAVEITAMAGVMPWMAPGAVLMNAEKCEQCRHSMAVGLGMRVLVQVLAIEPPDYLVTCGLLHDIGKLAFHHYLQLDHVPIAKLSMLQQKTVDEIEREYLGVDHAEFGSMILHSWQYPIAIQQSIRFHHSPERSEDYELLTGLVHCSDAMALMLGIGIESEGLNYHVSDVVRTRLNLSAEKMELAASEVLLRLEELQRYMRRVSEEGA